MASTDIAQLEAAAARMLRAEVDVLQAQAKYDRLVFGIPTAEEPAAAGAGQVSGHVQRGQTRSTPTSSSDCALRLIDAQASFCFSVTGP